MNLEVKNLTKAYGDHVVLDGFTHSFPEGRVTAIEGRSGCGKTTLLRLIADLERPNAGAITGVPEGGIGMVFQEDRLPPQLTAADCLRSVLRKALPFFSATTSPSFVIFARTSASRSMLVV